MEFFKIRKDIPFMRHALAFNVVSLVTFLLAVFFLYTKGLNFSIEFTGGTVLEVIFSTSAACSEFTSHNVAEFFDRVYPRDGIGSEIRASRPKREEPPDAWFAPRPR